MLDKLRSALSYPPRKASLAHALAATPWTRVLRAMEPRLPHIRVFNYHGVPAVLSDAFEHQLDHLLDRYRPVGLAELLSGRRALAPSVLFTFDDGIANHFDVVAPALERRGLRGVFSVPADFPSVPVGDQAAWFRRHVRAVADAEHPDGECRAMSWDQLRELQHRGHVVCSHTYTHLRITAATPMESVRSEIVGSRQRMADELNTSVAGFCWPVAYDADAREAHRLVRDTYEFALGGDSRPLRALRDPYRIARTNLEASWPLEAVDLQLSGVVDVKLAVGRAFGALSR